MKVLASICLSLAISVTPKGPRFSWETLPIFFHSANKSGPVNDESIKFMAQFPMVTIEKFQGPCGNRGDASPECDQEGQIVDVLRRVKEVNPNVSTIFYYNSVLDFPQYKLHAIVAKDESLMLHNAAGELVKMSGGGHKNMDVFDFSNPRTRELYIEECVNATQSGYVDGCFCDRAVDGTPSDSGDDKVPSGKKYNLTDAKAQAYFDGHIKVLTDMQKALGEGPVIANHAYGPDHDKMVRGSVSFAMDEFFKADNNSINLLLTCAKNGRGVQVHGKNDESRMAAFLIGAGYRAYYGLGGWGTQGKNFDDHWMSQFSLPLGEPLGDAIYDSADGGIWTRRFAHGVNVTFRVKAKKGTVVPWWGGPSPSPAPSPQPAPLPAPTAQCPEVLYGGFGHGDVGKTMSADWAACCADCAAEPKCVHWTWGESNKPNYCHLHDGTATHNKDVTSGRFSGSVVRTGLTVI